MSSNEKMNIGTSNEFIGFALLDDLKKYVIIKILDKITPLKNRKVGTIKRNKKILVIK
tara:strand:+ start:1838 stop:2011 length:174 start_codon:yes stop_codon:yes gene_type:complete